MEVKDQSQTEPMEIIQTELTAEIADVSKYNLRCNRNISGKMTKKDFIYDIRRPLQGTRKYEEHKQRVPFIVPTRIRKSKHADGKMGKYSTIGNNDGMDGGDNAAILTLPRDLKFECNFCHEPMATLSSLSTHVKFHQRRYCKECYWIYEEGETMGKHFEKIHRTKPGR